MANPIIFHTFNESVADSKWVNFKDSIKKLSIKKETVEQQIRELESKVDELLPTNEELYSSNPEVRKGTLEKERKIEELNRQIGNLWNFDNQDLFPLDLLEDKSYEELSDEYLISIDLAFGGIVVINSNPSEITEDLAPLLRVIFPDLKISSDEPFEITKDQMKFIFENFENIPQLIKQKHKEVAKTLGLESDTEDFVTKETIWIIDSLEELKPIAEDLKNVNTELFIGLGNDYDLENNPKFKERAKINRKYLEK